MYEIFEIVLAVLIIGIGVLMVAFPKACVKKEMKDNPEQLERARKNGYIEIVVGVVLLLLYFL